MGLLAGYRRRTAKSVSKKRRNVERRKTFAQGMNAHACQKHPCPYSHQSPLPNLQPSTSKQTKAQASKCHATDNP
eukprot:7104404-Karenia_brevis.AAC.1